MSRTIAELESELTLSHQRLMRWRRIMVREVGADEARRLFRADQDDENERIRQLRKEATQIVND